MLFSRPLYYKYNLLIVSIKIAPSRCESGGRRNSNLKLRIIKRLKVHGVMSGLFHPSVGYMKMFSEFCGMLNFCAVGWF